MSTERRPLLTRATHRVSRICERYVNQRRAYDFPPTADMVAKYPSPVLGNEVTGSMFDPCVVALPEGGFAMFVSHRRGGSIERWDSENGIDWTRRCVALTPSHEAGAWDSVVNRTGVLVSEGGWLMWYTGQRSGESAIGLATSSDGVSFKRVSISPVLAPELPCEGGSVMNPCVIADEAGYRMWYAAGEDYEPDVICEARSADGLEWKKNPKPVLTKGDKAYDAYKVGGCSVLRLAEQTLAMFYIGYQNLDVARVCLAVSDDDGLTWRRSPANPLVGPARGAWDAHAVYKPSALLDCNGVIRLWYNARKDRDEYVGMATVEDIGRLS